MNSRIAQIFIEGIRLDLFKDEQINISSTIQTVQDISKVFTDFTQSFTVPASAQNNELFQHYYNNDVLNRDGVVLDSNIRRNADIQIDGTIFRKGKMALEKANIVNAKVESYQITFYGQLTALKDTFGELKLNELDWTTLNHDYTFTEISNRVSDGSTTYDVRYPLISPERYWQYNNPTTPTENIDTLGGAIFWLELFPAVKLNKIFEVISTHYGISFIGNFLTDERFTKCYQYFKNKTGNVYNTPSIALEMDNVYKGTTVYATTPSVYNFVLGTSGNDIIIDLGNNTIQLAYIEYVLVSIPTPIYTDFGFHDILFQTIGCSPSNVTYFVDVYRNGSLISTATQLGGGDAIISLVRVNNNGAVALSDVYNFVFRSETPMSCTGIIKYQFDAGVPVGHPMYDQYREMQCNTVSGLITFGVQNLSDSAPNITVEKWFSNILKVFNLTCYGTDENVYQVEPLDDWYNRGIIYDITEYTEVSKIDVARIKLWERVLFNYKQSKSLTNRFFLSQFKREYGDLQASFPYDGGEYKTEVIFENILHSKFTGENLQVGYCLDENTNPYVPEPVLLYEYDELTCDFFLTDDITNTNITTYVPFGQDARILGTDRSLNWGAENSSLLDVVNFNGLYDDYYRNYIENLYNPRNRQTTVKVVLPISMLTDIDLNDRVVIRDKRYLIDTMKTNLTTGEVTLVLLNDFRTLISDGGTLEPIKRISEDAQTVNQYIPLPKNSVSATITECGTTTTGLTIVPSTITRSQPIALGFPALSPYYEYINSEQESIFFSTDDGKLLVLDEGIDRDITFCVEYTLNDGSTTTSRLFYIQSSDRI